jgi:hypothetical protein
MSVPGLISEISFASGKDQFALVPSAEDGIGHAFVHIGASAAPAYLPVPPVFL